MPGEGNLNMILLSFVIFEMSLLLKMNILLKRFFLFMKCF